MTGALQGSSGYPLSVKSGKKYFFKVRELSVNSEIFQGFLELSKKSGNLTTASRENN